jgi:hypothetical protein
MTIVFRSKLFPTVLYSLSASYFIHPESEVCGIRVSVCVYLSVSLSYVLPVITTLRSVVNPSTNPHS